MQPASQAYKSIMKEKWRNTQSFLRVTIGLINQQAQASAHVSAPEDYTYYSNLKWPFDNYQIQELYAACDQNYTTTDGSMYFMPREKGAVVLNQGIVSENPLGPIEIQFPIPYDIKGLTIEFGRAYPKDFTIESDNNTIEITGNTDGHFVTEEIFSDAAYLRFVPHAMVNGQGRFRIHTLTMGIGIYFDNRSILSATKKEYISPIMEELPAIDFDLTVNNKDRSFDIENETSTVNFLETGQKIEVLYGQELADGAVEWLPGAAVQLKEWSADDDEMNFSATDRFDSMDGTYYRGKYYPEGISLYDLAVDVLKDAGADSRTYWLDSYLKTVFVTNPMPVVSHKEALQLIANAGRCVMSQDRSGNIVIKSSFVPKMSASSENAAYFSHVERVLDKTPKDSYAMAAQDYTDTLPTQYFLPRQGSGEITLNTGYISKEVAGVNGFFDVNPTLEIQAEAAYKCFGLTLEFGRNHPSEMVFHSYLDGVLLEDYAVTDLTAVTVISHEFPEFNRLVLEFTRHRVPGTVRAVGEYTYWVDHDGFLLLDGDGSYLTADGETAPAVSNSRVVLDNIIFGDSTDYELSYEHELTKTPKGTQLTKIRELQVVRTMYSEGGELKELVREQIDMTAADGRYTFYLSHAAYGLSCAIINGQAGQTAAIVESGAYYAVVELTGVSGPVEVAVTGREYILTSSRVSRQLNPLGSLEIWENPLVSDTVHAVNLADWIGDYMRSDREYDLQYRGEPRIDANDIAFLENKYVPDMLIRIYEHTLKFNGALSGTIKARREMGKTAARRR